MWSSTTSRTWKIVPEGFGEIVHDLPGDGWRRRAALTRPVQGTKLCNTSFCK